MIFGSGKITGLTALANQSPVSIYLYQSCHQRSRSIRSNEYESKALHGRPRLMITLIKKRTSTTLLTSIIYTLYLINNVKSLHVQCPYSDPTNQNGSLQFPQGHLKRSSPDFIQMKDLKNRHNHELILISYT